MKPKTFDLVSESVHVSTIVSHLKRCSHNSVETRTLVQWKVTLERANEAGELIKFGEYASGFIVSLYSYMVNKGLTDPLPEVVYRWLIANRSNLQAKETFNIKKAKTL